MGRLADRLRAAEALERGAGLNHQQRRWLAALLKRVDHLTERIEDEAARGRDLTFDKEERAALRWAIEFITTRLREEA